KLSITKHFSDQGWRGINVDASPVQWELLTAARPRDINLNIGVSSKRGEMTFYRAVADAYGGDASGLSTFVAEEVAIHRANGFVFGMFDGLNRYYVRSEDTALIPKLQVPPNVFDDFVPYEYQHQVDELEAEVRMLRASQKVMTTVGGLAKWVGKQAETARGRI